MLQLACVKHGCWKDMTRQSTGSYFLSQAKNIGLKKKRNRKQRHQKSRNKIPYDQREMGKKFWS